MQPSELATVNLNKQNTTSVVLITNIFFRIDSSYFDVLEESKGIGAGCIWDDNGLVVTCFHVISGASRLRVTLADNTTYDAIAVGIDQHRDVAVLYVDAPKEKLKPVQVGLSSNLLVGQDAFAIGHPFGLLHSLTQGLISGLRREIKSAATGLPVKNVIQTSAAINPGNSGGPLINSSGEVIGVNTSLYSRSGDFCGVGFAISAETVSWFYDELVKFRKITRPVLSLRYTERSTQQSKVNGVLVLDVFPNGPADKAGIRSTKPNNSGGYIPGDIIRSVNKKKVAIQKDFDEILDQCKFGETIIVEVFRVDHLEEIPVVL